VVHADDDLDLNGICGDTRTPSQWTIRVASLLRTPGAAERWQQRCHDSFKENRLRGEALTDWHKQRAKFLSWEAHKKGRPSKEPPAERWVLATERVVSPEHTSPDHLQTALMQAWVPPELGNDQAPYAGGPLPFSKRLMPSLADSYFVLALVHNNERRTGQITMFSPDDEDGLFFCRCQQEHITSCMEHDPLTLDDCIVKVAADLDTLSEPSKRGINQTTTQKRAVKGKHIDAQMLKVLAEKPESYGWSARQWADELKCSDGTVKATNTWKERLKAVRARLAVDASAKMDKSGTYPKGRRKPMHTSDA
jgi:hypothetical protein